MRAQFTREQRTTVVYGILCLELILVVLQLWLLMATMDAFLGKGRRGGPATGRPLTMSNDPTWQGQWSSPRSGRGTTAQERWEHFWP